MPISYHIYSKADKDKAQAKFNVDGNIQAAKPAIITSIIGDEPLFCPFCLYEAKISEFLSSTKKQPATTKNNSAPKLRAVIIKDGVYKNPRKRTRKKGISSMIKCPECKNAMKIRSLTATASIEGYAQWVFNYSKSGFWKKCDYKKWKDRLRNFGWSSRFWFRYKQLKGEIDSNENYEEWLEKTRRGQAEEE